MLYFKMKLTIHPKSLPSMLPFQLILFIYK